MTLTTHAVAGAVIAKLLPGYPILGLFLAFCSHFILDAFPHWDYPLRSYREEKNSSLNGQMDINSHFLRDFLHVSLDSALGLALSFILVSKGQIDIYILVAAFVAQLPDVLQFVYWKIKREPLTSLQKFHIWIHTKNKMKKMKILSIASQLIFIALITSFLN